MIRHDRDFSAWWNEADDTDGFGPAERAIYLELSRREQETTTGLVRGTGLPWNRVQNALAMLEGTGVVLKVDDESFAVGAKLFKEWVHRQGLDRPKAPG